MYEFCSAALPWIALGVVIAVFAAYSGGKCARRPAWAVIGFFGGIVLASLLGISTSIGMLFGLTASLLLSGRATCGEAETK